MRHILVIAIGNPLRCVDGIAWATVESLREDLPDSTMLICVHQLTPDLGEDASRADTVIFLDAAKRGATGKITVEEISSQPGVAHFSHSLAPADILDISERLYGSKPRAFVVSVNCECFDHGQKLSESATQAIPKIGARVLELVTALDKDS